MPVNPIEDIYQLLLQVDTKVNLGLLKLSEIQTLLVESSPESGISQEILDQVNAVLEKAEMIENVVHSQAMALEEKILTEFEV